MQTLNVIDGAVAINLIGQYFWIWESSAILANQTVATSKYDYHNCG